MIWLINLIIFILLFIVEREVAQSIMGYLYLIQYASFIYYIINKFKKNLKTVYFFSPSFITLSYICLTFGFAAIYLNNGHGNLYKFNLIYFNSNSFTIANFYFLLCNFIVFIVYILKLNNYSKYVFVDKLKNSVISKKTLYLAIVIFFIFTEVELDASLFGGNGSLSFVPKFVSVIVITFYFSKTKNKYRYLIYLFFLAMFLISSFDSKREIIFLLITIIFIEFSFNKRKVTFSLINTFWSFLILFFFLGIILISSVMRGYGSYEVDSIQSAIEKVPQYIGSDIFLDSFGENLELNYSYGNALNAADIFLEGKQELLYGETFLKAFLVPIPKSIVDFRASSMMSLYSPMINYGSGEIQPVVLYSELLWNFGILFFLPLIIIFYCAENIFTLIIKHFSSNHKFNFKILICIFICGVFLQFIRGSGLDLLTVYIIFALPFAKLITFINNK